VAHWAIAIGRIRIKDAFHLPPKPIDLCVQRQPVLRQQILEHLWPLSSPVVCFDLGFRQMQRVAHSLLRCRIRTTVPGRKGLRVTRVLAGSGVGRSATSQPGDSQPQSVHRKYTRAASCTRSAPGWPSKRQ
jgi:hypothetical protein